MRHFCYKKWALWISLVSIARSDRRFVDEKRKKRTQALIYKSPITPDRPSTVSLHFWLMVVRRENEQLATITFQTLIDSERGQWGFWSLFSAFLSHMDSESFHQKGSFSAPNNLASTKVIALERGNPCISCKWPYSWPGRGPKAQRVPPMSILGNSWSNNSTK